MERSFDRELDCYTEKHHIVPRCMGGDDKPRNLAVLTAEKHFLAHALLAKIYPENHKMVYALQAMRMNAKGKRGSRKLYGWMKRRFIETHTGRVVTDETRAKISKARKGRVVTAETRAKLSKVSKGRVHSPETRANISKTLKGKVFSAEHRANLSKAHKGKVLSAGTRARISKANKGNVWSAGTRAKMSQVIRKPVHQISLSGELINRFTSATEAKEITGVCSKGISRVCNGKRKTAGGFIWKFPE